MSNPLYFKWFHGRREPCYNGKLMKTLKAVFAVLLAAHVIIGAARTSAFFLGSVVPWAVRVHAVPEEDRLMTMSPTEATFIKFARASLPLDGHILWLPEADPIVNYYIFPRRMYFVKEHSPGEPPGVTPEFLKDRGIKYIMHDFVNLRMTEVPQ